MLLFKKRRATAQFKSPQAWREIENHFKTYFDGKFSEMHQLVQYLQKNRLTAGLYGYASGTKLVVSPQKKINPKLGALHIEFSLASEQWLFSYRITPQEGPQYIRKFDKSLGYEKFEKFLKLILAYSE